MNVALGRNVKLGLYCVFEDGAQKVDGRFIRSEGGIAIGDDVTLQSHVSVKRGLTRGTNTKIGEGTYVCSFVNIGHNVQIGRECFIATGAKILGNVVLSDHVYVGSGAIVTQDLQVGTWVKIRAGEVVDVDIPDDTYYGLRGRMVANRYSPRFKIAQ